MCLSRLLSREDFGRYATAYAYSSFIAVCAAFGLDRAVQLRMGQSLATDSFAGRQITNTVYRCLAATITFTVVLAAFVFGLTQEYYADASINWALFVSVAMIGCGRSLVIVGAATARAHDRPVYANLLGGSLHAGPSANGLFLALLLATHLVGFHTTSLFALTSLAIATLVVGLGLYCVNMFGPDPDTTVQSSTGRSESVGSLLQLSLPIFGITFSQIIVSELDVALLSRFAASEEIALYAVCRRLIILLGIPLGLLNLTIVSSISELYTSGKITQLSHIAQLAAGLASIPIVIAVVVLAVFPETVLSLLFGPEYTEGAQFLRALLPGQLVFSFSGACGLVLVQTGHARLELISSIVSAVTLFTVGAIAASSGNVFWYALTVSSIVAIKNGLAWFFAVKYVGVRTHPKFSGLLLAVRQRSLFCDVENSV